MSERVYCITDDCRRRWTHEVRGVNNLSAAALTCEQCLVATINRVTGSSGTVLVARRLVQVLRKKGTP